jgi:hypothetical protein
MQLEMFYSLQYVPNEEIANVKSGVECFYKFDHDPVPNTISGTIYYNDVPLCVFLSKLNDLEFQFIDTKEDLPTVLSGKVDSEGVIITWDRKIGAGKSCLVVRYEYSLECNSPLIECPKCNHKFFDPPANFPSLEDLANGEGNLDLY